MTRATVQEEPAVTVTAYSDGGSRQRWLNDGLALLQTHSTQNFALGDWALRTPPEASRDEIRELLEEVAAKANIDVRTLYDVRTVSARIPRELRHPALSWYAHKEISKLAVSGDEDKSLALRAEFIRQFGESSDPSVRLVRDAVRAKMGTKDAEPDQASKSVSFKLTTDEYATLEFLVAGHPVHERAADLVQEIVRDYLATQRADA